MRRHFSAAIGTHLAASDAINESLAFKTLSYFYVPYKFNEMHSLLFQNKFLKL
jgi:hypothetical protein